MNLTHASLGAALALTTLFFGCDSSTSTPAPSPAPVATKAGEGTTVSAPKPDDTKVDLKNVSFTEKELAAIKKLPEADQKLAMDQKVCPVGGSHLGAMGMPVKMDLKGQTVFLCCDGCEEEAKEKADSILAKLGKK